MTTLIAAEIEEAILAGHAPSLVLLDALATKELLAEVLFRFVDRPNRVWWWEGLKGEVVAFQNDEMTLNWLGALCTEGEDHFFLISLPDAGDPQIALKGSLLDIAAALQRCSLFEFAVIPSSLKWIACENHHNAVFISGRGHGLVLE